MPCDACINEADQYTYKGVSKLLYNLAGMTSQNAPSKVYASLNFFYSVSQ